MWWVVQSWIWHFMYYSKLILLEQWSSVVKPLLNVEALEGKVFFCVMVAKQCHAISCKRTRETIWQMFWWLFCRKQKVFAWLCWFPEKLHIHICQGFFNIAFSLNVNNMLSWQTRVLQWEHWGIHQIMKWPSVVKKETRFSSSPMQMRCLKCLVSTWCPTFCVSLSAKTGSPTLMFNSAIVFDKRFCLDCDPQEGTSVANLAYMLYLWKKVGWNNKC